MASVIGLIVLLLATLTLGGCAGLPLGALASLANSGAYGGGYGGAYGGGYGGYPQGYPSAAAIPVPVPMDPGYAGGYAPQAQPYYAPQPYGYNYNGATAYAPGQGDPTVSAGIDQREREQAARIRQGLRDGSLTPQEAQRLWAEQRRIRGAEGRMMADGSLSPQEQARLTAMQNRAGRDIYNLRHNGVVQPGTPAPQPGVGPAGPIGPVAQPQINGAPMPGPAQVRPMQPGYGPRVQPVQPNNQRYRRIAATPGG